MASDQLVPIPADQWPALRNLFKDDWPENEVPYFAIQNYIDWTNRDPRIRHLEILSLNGSWRENGTFIIIDRYEMYFFTLESSNESLKRALELIDWDYPYKICVILDKHQPPLDYIFQKYSLERPYFFTTYVYYMTKEDALKLKVKTPEGFHFDELKLEHASHINAGWPHRSAGSEYAVKRMIAWNPNLGLYDSNGELVGWCLVSALGFISLLQIEEQHKRKGLGELTLKAISVKLAEKGLNIYGSIVRENAPSRALFEKVGFRQEQKLYWSRNTARKLVEWE